jgi:hypothetical protein
MQRARPVIADELEQIAARLAGYVRRSRATDAELLRAVAELEQLAVSFRVVSLDGEGGVWLSAAEVAAARGVSVRTVERWARAGRLEARWEGGRWQIRQSSSTERGG